MGNLRTGGLEDWRTGGLEDWRTGGLEDWRTGCNVNQYSLVLTSIIQVTIYNELSNNHVAAGDSEAVFRESWYVLVNTIVLITSFIHFHIIYSLIHSSFHTSFCNVYFHNNAYFSNIS